MMNFAKAMTNFVTKMMKLVLKVMNFGFSSYDVVERRRQAPGRPKVIIFQKSSFFKIIIFQNIIIFQGNNLHF